MARILYGVMGDARGHVARALNVAAELPHHEFLFVGGGAVRDVRNLGYPVEEVPMASTLYRNNRVDFPATVAHAVKVFAGSRPVVSRVAEIIKGYDPHLILSDYEYFTPLAARKLGRPCVSLDHQHIITHCAYRPPAEQRISRFLTSLAISRLYSSASLFLIVSFFAVPPTNPLTTRVLPPIIGRDVAELPASQGDHVLVYQTSPTFHRLLPVLETLESRFIIYGHGKKPERKNLVFKAPSRSGFLADLASCRYAITNGGHNVLSEALYLHKPLLTFPIANAYEQFLNAYFVRSLGYGDYSVATVPPVQMLRDFESRIDQFRGVVRTGEFFGNRHVTEAVESLIRRGVGGTFPAGGASDRPCALA